MKEWANWRLGELVNPERLAFNNSPTRQITNESETGMDHLWQDIVHGARSLAKYPVSCAVAIVSLAACRQPMGERDFFRRGGLIGSYQRGSRERIGAGLTGGALAQEPAQLLIFSAQQTVLILQLLFFLSKQHQFLSC